MSERPTVQPNKASHVIEPAAGWVAQYGKGVRREHLMAVWRKHPYLLKPDDEVLFRLQWAINYDFTAVCKGGCDYLFGEIKQMAIANRVNDNALLTEDEAREWASLITDMVFGYRKSQPLKRTFASRGDSLLEATGVDKPVFDKPDADKESAKRSKKDAPESATGE